MSQNDLILADQAGASFRADVNSALQALGSLSSGATAPSTAYAYQFWADTTTNTLKQRNAANSAWIVRGTLDESFVLSRSSNTILDISDRDKVLIATGSYTQTLDAAATLTDGWGINVIIDAGVTLVIDPNGAETIDGAVTKSIIGPAQGRIVCNGTLFRTIGFSALPVYLGVNMINGILSATRAGSAETIAIKTMAGSDPSAADPVYIAFRNVAAGTGDLSIITLTAATSITISSGSTIGASNGVPFRFWLVGFNDAGTFRLGVINCLSGVNIYPLGQSPIASSTAEGGAGAADSAQVFYTGTAVTAKPYAVLAYLDYTLATAGTWNTAPSRIQLFGAGVPLPGSVIQMQRNDTGAVATGTTTIPADNTIPQSTEGDQYLSQAITPTSAANLLGVSASITLANNASPTLISALFQDAVANALKSEIANTNAAGASGQMTINARFLAALTSATTFKVRGGSNTAGTTTFNGTGGAGLFNGTMNSFIQIIEVMA